MAKNRGKEYWTEYKRLCKETKCGKKSEVKEI